MLAGIHFTKHAVEKFAILAHHGVVISREQVVETVEHPDVIDRSRMPLKIAQRGLNRMHVLRAVYGEENGMKVIITFYPGRKSQDEKE